MVFGSKCGGGDVYSLEWDEDFDRVGYGNVDWYWYEERLPSSGEFGGVERGMEVIWNTHKTGIVNEMSFDDDGGRR